MKYSKEIADKIIEAYATGNQSIQDICKAAGIARETFYSWKKNAAFKKKLDAAHKQRLDAIGDMALTGLALLVQKHEYEETTVEYVEDKNGKPKIKSQKKVKKVIMPNPSMVALALTNRQSEDWKQRQTIAHTGENDGPISTEMVLKIGYGKKEEDQDD